MKTSKLVLRLQFNQKDVFCFSGLTMFKKTASRSFLAVVSDWPHKRDRSPVAGGNLPQPGQGSRQARAYPGRKVE
jgi:hypothetical protein